MADDRSEHYFAIVDMGSNGIRFSITDMSPTAARVMPTLYQDRLGLSLYDAQWPPGSTTKQPIPQPIIDDVARALLRFKSTCEDFGLRTDPASKRVRVIATEATRQAINSTEFRVEIKKMTGWDVEMLAKEDEGRVGAMGVASSFEKVKGLMMDLGGGSTQITWLGTEDGEVRMSDAGSVSMPYGAAALTRRLAEANKSGAKAVQELRDEITANLKDAVAKIDIPKEILDPQNGEQGIPLYLSGGGFRGWGFVLMSQHPVSPYPIPIINGFKTSTALFHNVEMVETAAAATRTGETSIFRVSERRASQVPAVALLVSCLAEALPAIGTVYFAQGGVREGALYERLPKDVRAKHPLCCATVRYATSGCESIQTLMQDSIPSGSTSGGKDHKTPLLPAAMTKAILTAFAQSLYIHNAANKDLQAASALRSTTSGVLSTIHGTSHEERAILALILCERWGGGGALAPGDESFYRRLVQLLGAEVSWWCMYFGRVGQVVGECYPAGVVREGGERLHLKANWVDAEHAEGEVGKKMHKDAKKMKKKAEESVAGTGHGQHALRIELDFGKDEQGLLQSMGVRKALKQLEKLGKKKNWPDADASGEGKGKSGYRIELKVKGGRGNVNLEDEGELELA